jgi:hypothetical protein
VRLIDFFPSWRRETLHAVAATAKQDSAEYVDQYMKCPVEVFDVLAVSFFQGTLSRIVEKMAYYSDRKVDQKNDRSAYRKAQHAAPPPNKTLYEAKQS